MNVGSLLIKLMYLQGGVSKEEASRKDVLISVYPSSGSYSLTLVMRNRPAATRLPNKGPTQYIQSHWSDPLCMMACTKTGPVPMAGLNAAPDMCIPDRVAAPTVRPIARPKNELSRWCFVV